MTCVKIKNGIVCLPNIYMIKVNGRTYYYEWHCMFGPWPVKKDGTPYKKGYFGKGCDRVCKLVRLLEKRREIKTAAFALMKSKKGVQNE